MKIVAVVLSGCGFQDGSEITESISTLIALSENKIAYKAFAPDITFQSSNHINGEAQDSRNTLIESARITRGKIHNLSTLNHEEFDALVFPGGFGVALHLCNWAEKGSQCKVNQCINLIVKSFYEKGKPICAICIAPALIAKILGKNNVSLTIGDDKATILEIEKTGAYHVKCKVDDYVSDRENKIISTPAYMFEDASPHAVFSGIRKAIKELSEMA